MHANKKYKNIEKKYEKSGINGWLYSNQWYISSSSQNEKPNELTEIKMKR